MDPRSKCLEAWVEIVAFIMISIMIVNNNNNNNNNNDDNNNNNNILLTCIAQILMKHFKEFNCLEKALLFFHRRAKGSASWVLGARQAREGKVVRPYSWLVFLPPLAWKQQKDKGGPFTTDFEAPSVHNDVDYIDYKRTLRLFSLAFLLARKCL